MYQILYIYFTPQVYNKLKIKYKCFPDEGGKKATQSTEVGYCL